MPPKAAKSKKVSASADAVVPLTTQLFALGTKHPKNTVKEQEALFHDLLVLIRHGERQDHVDRGWKGNGLLPVQDPPLSNTGRKQSLETALKYYALQREKKVEDRIQGTFSYILVSPFHRCLETALILNIVAFDGALAIFVDPQLSDWQQSKVFRTPPALGGCYTTVSSTSGNPKKKEKNAGAGAEVADSGGEQTVVFRPQLDALRSALGPFFQSSAGNMSDIAETYHITLEVAQQWGTHLEDWLAHHTSLPVWTSRATEQYVRDRLAASLATEAEDADKPAPQGGGGSKNKTAKQMNESRESNCFALCGVSHPESKTDLARRCQQVAQTHFFSNEDSLAQTPRLVQAAVAKERKERLPKYFEVFTQRPALSQESAGPAALLPPMHVVAVTHADVVAGMVDTCCPKYLGDASGKSVPYCSITELSRHNNYYRIPPVEERDRATGTGGSSGTGVAARGKGRGRGSGRGAKPANAGNSAASARATLSSRADFADELSVEWHVNAVGSTDLLRTTKVVLQFS